MTRIAVAAISARMLAEAARADGFEVAALDLFGDADTRRAASQWAPIGAPGDLHVDGALLLAALQSAAQRFGAVGWVAGSGFDGRADLLEAGATLLPLLGNRGDAVRRVRDPAAFFGTLDAAGVAHPEVHFTARVDTANWLVKDPQGCGGWHIRRAGPDADVVTPPRYFQRRMAGVPMSATFLADGRRAHVLGFNELIVRALGARPYVYCGAVGPVALAAGVARRVREAVSAVVAGFGLRGLGSLDFMLDAGAMGVLEVNPRPPASMALYADRRFGGGAHGLFAAHVLACTHGELPEPAAPPAGDAVHGTEIVFAPRRLHLDEPTVRRLGQRSGCHDLPASALDLAAGDPVCSVSALGTDTAQVRSQLDRGRDAVHHLLETSP